MKTNSAVRILALIGIVAIILGALLPALTAFRY